MPGRFLAMVGALIWRRSDGRYLVLQRSDTRDVGAGEWECVTGRLEQGESFLQALRREVLEELGVEVQVEFVLRTAHSFRGEALPENEMVGVRYGCSIEAGTGIRLSHEHCGFDWVTAEEACQMFPDGHSLRNLILRAETVRKFLPEELLKLYRSDSFDF